MVFLTVDTTLTGIHQRRPIPLPVYHLIHNHKSLYLFFFYPSFGNGTRWFSTGTESSRTEFSGENAYVLLGVSEASSFTEIKASFRKLAKETHPDLAQSNKDSSASKRFVQILAAYEILSDSEKRAHYDMYLLSQRKLMQKNCRQASTIHIYQSHRTTTKQMEVVEWLKWYRYAINDILAEKKVFVGTGYFDVLEADFYSAIHAAYYGPEIESMELLPDCFEAEERSMYENPEVLHLVSGRDLFGMVCLVNKVPELTFSCNERLTSFASVGLSMCQPFENPMNCMNYDTVDNAEDSPMESRNVSNQLSDAYKDLELHISGRVVAVATRVPPKTYCEGIQDEDTQDHIHVFIRSDEIPTYNSKEPCLLGGGVGSRIPLGRITGLGSSPDEGSCFVYNSSGTKTHVIMKHRTLMVKHMHWYRVGDEVSVCECRCSRARLPPSRFWLFEPRCGMHDIGGWYVETFGRDKKDRTVLSQRYWDGIDANDQFDKRLHPAMYLLALAYRTLDLEDAKRRKQTIKDIFDRKLFRVLSWCKKLV